MTALRKATREIACRTVSDSVFAPRILFAVFKALSSTRKFFRFKEAIKPSVMMYDFYSIHQEDRLVNFYNE